MRGIKHTLETIREIYYKKFPDSNIKILKILPNEKVICKDKYSEYITFFYSLYNNYLPTFSVSTNKNQHFINKAKEIHGDKYDYSLIKLNKMSNKVQIICKKHGSFNQRASSHIFGQGCSKCCIDFIRINKLSNKNEFIIKANLKHHNKYNYSLVEYVNAKTKVKIICPIHGEFSQIPNSHLIGKSCRECAKITISKYNSENPSSWNYTNWEKAGNKSKNFDSFKLYIIECWNEEERFFKIGKTYKKITKRFNSLVKMPYKFKIISIIEKNSKEISELEKELQKVHKDLKYIPKILFKGNNECYSKIKTNI